MLNHPTRHRAPTSTGRCTNCHDLLPSGSPVGRMYCTQCAFPIVRRLRAKSPKRVRK